MQTDEDLFVVRARIAADRTRAAPRASPGRPGGRGPASARGPGSAADSSRAGTVLAGERPGTEPTTTAGRPC